MQPQIYDLFGQIPVYLHYIEAWLWSVPRISPDSPRAPAYIRGYDVIGKIQAAKLRGDFDQVVRPRPAPPAHWWLRWHWF